MTPCRTPAAPAATKNSSKYLVRDAVYPDIASIRSARCGSRIISSASMSSLNGGVHPRAAVASTNSCAYGSVNSGHSAWASPARAMAMLSAVAPTHSVMSQVSSSVRAIRPVFPAVGVFTHLVFGQQIVANVSLTVGQLSDAVSDDRRGDQGEQAGQDEHADVDVSAQPDRGAAQHQD